MIIAVASGKGGTGKTTVAVSLALSLIEGGVSGESKLSAPLLVDCDVEEPNIALHLNPELEEERRVGHMIPKVYLSLCTFCGRCAEVCRYNAISVAGQRVIIFSDLCHSCGSCRLNCPEGAIEETLEILGTIERGRSGELGFAQGTLQVGRALSVPLIRQLKEWVIPTWDGRGPIILDGPPGTSCPVVETLRGADYALLVTEPTPFGLHDLRLAVEVSREALGLPVGVVINREGIGDDQVEQYCREEKVPIVMRIPYDKRIAEACSEGIPLVEALPEYRGIFRDLYDEIRKSVHQINRSASG